MIVIPISVTLSIFMPELMHALETDKDNSSHVTLCEESWTNFGDYCYKYEGNKLGQDTYNGLSWRDASARCFQLGGYLASIHSEKENDFVTNNLMTSMPGFATWIGLYTQGNSTDYEWQDGTPVTYDNLAPIDLRQRHLKSIPKISYLPISFTGRNVVEMYSELKTLAICNSEKNAVKNRHWLYYEFHAPLNYICKRKAFKISGERNETDKSPVEKRLPLGIKIYYKGKENEDAKIEGETPTTALEYRNGSISNYEYSCKKGWINFGENCYIHEGRNGTIGLGWRDAAARCYQLGGYLASIHSQKENDFIYSSLVKKTRMFAWIGIYVGESKEYKWQDGSPVTYENWEPENLPRKFSHYTTHLGDNVIELSKVLSVACMEKDSGQWLHHIYADSLPYVCKRKAKRIFSERKIIEEATSKSLLPTDIQNLSTHIDKDADRKNSCKYIFLATAVSVIFLTGLAITVVVEISKKCIELKKHHSRKIYNKLRNSSYGYEVNQLQDIHKEDCILASCHI